MQTWNRTALKSLVAPGGILLAIAALLAHSGWASLTPPAVSFLYYCAIVGGILLAWRFHSTRTFFGLLVLFLAEQAVAFFGGLASPASSAWTGAQAAAILLPTDFVLIALMHERGFALSSAAPLALLLFVQTVIVSVLCNTASTSPLTVHRHHVPPTVSLPGYALLFLTAAGVFLLVRTLLTRKPVDSALLWSLAAFFLSLRFTSPHISSLYSAAAACILVTGIIENSYLLAYHDELTTLRSRRAFNDALLRLQQPYSIAVVDIDHFKRFNDTYGHETGDQVLRLVAAHLLRVTGGGQAYRCGGEEFAVLFPGKTTLEIVDHLERLRTTIAYSEFRLRGTDRRQIPRGPDRRNQRAPTRPRKGHAIRQLAQPKAAESVAVTVSIGAADASTTETDPATVIQAADEALYRAKANGRNRIELATPTRQRTRTKTAGIA